MRSLDITHRDEIVAGQHTKERDYWLKKLSGHLERICFPYDHNKAGIGAGESQFKKEEFELGGELFSRLLFISNKSDSRLYMILAAGLVVLLSKYTDRSDIIIGTPTIKQAVEVKFINTVMILRNQLQETKTFKDLLKQVRETLVEAAEHVNYPLETLLYKLNLPISQDSFPLFDVAILLENIHDRRYLRHIRLNTIFSFSRQDDSIKGELEYNQELYKKATIERIITHFIHLLRQLVFNVDLQVAEIEILPKEEKELILCKFNDTDAEYPRDKTIHELFEGQVGRTPDNIATVSMEHGAWSMERSTNIFAITYQKLNEKSNQLALLLRVKGIGPNCIVGIMVERSIDMIIGMLGILKAGGAYLPMDGNYPDERNRYMLKECAVKILITREELKERFDVDQVITLDEKEITGLPAMRQINPGISGNPDNLFYVIYTSGSTGKPKGVLIRQKGFANLVFMHQKLFKEDHNSRMSQVASITFDAMAFEIWPCLLNSASLYIADNEVRMDPFLLKEWLIENKITISFQPTIIAEQLLRETWPERGVSLKVLLTAGDKLTRYPTHLYPFVLYNLYGPTEDTVWSTCTEVEISTGSGKNPPIGKAIGNHHVYITGPGLELKPVGIAGELCLAGDGLAAGYLNRPELTMERFPANPFGNGTHLYRTGDLARWLPFGNIEFIGRIDYQVKIRGYRIELGEIENRLLKNKKVEEVVVIARDNEKGDKYLCAYIVGARESGKSLITDLDAKELREYLSGDLPDYMIPSYFMQIEKIPLTASGKVDREALPAPELGITGGEYVPPENEIQKNLTEIWQEVLGIKRIGITDNFFMIGGDSIKAVQISARLKKYKLNLKIDDLFLNPTIKELAGQIKESDWVIEQGVVDAEVELTPIQRWFFQNDFTGKHHFNHSVILYKETGFSAAFIEKIFAKIVEHHDALRMIYRCEAGEDKIVQRNRGMEGKLFDFEIFHFEDKTNVEDPIETEADRIQGSIDFERGPLVKLGLFKTSAGDHLLIVIHHLVVDGISWRILLEDFTTGYRQLERGEDIKFQDKTDSFKNWSQKLNEYATTIASEKSKKFVKELEYWREIETASLEPLPRDHEVDMEKKKTKYSEAVSLELDQEQTGRLLKKVNHAYNTEINDLLLTALGLALRDWSGHQKVLINLEGHGRESIINGVDISRTVGWFTSQFPLLLDMGKTDQLPEHIIQVKETLRQVPNKGIGYGILRYLVREQAKEGAPFNREPEVCFNYLGQFLQETLHQNNGGVFNVSRMKMGNLISPESEMIYVLDVRGLIVEGKLKLSFVYNGYQYRPAVIENLRDGCKQYLMDIIDHCTKKEVTQQTVSDFTASDFDEQEMEDLFDELENV